MKREELTSEEKHTIIVNAAEDKKANYLTSIDLSGKTLIADYFVICSGTSNIHIRAIADGIMEAMELRGHRYEALEGYGEASWVLLSYGDVIAHIMSEVQRNYYGLEKRWSGEEPERLDDSNLALEFDDLEAPKSGDSDDDDSDEDYQDDFGDSEIDEDDKDVPNPD